MKKFLLVLALTGCVFGMTACGNVEEEVFPYTQEQVESNTRWIFETLDNAVTQNCVDEAGKQLQEMYSDQSIDKMFPTACASWEAAKEEIGTYNGVIEGSVRAEGTATEFTIYATVDGSERDAQVELYYSEDALLIPDMMISPNYTLGEKMKKAALNTLLGMGTVFIVLILIMFIIMAFGIIPKIEKSIADKKAKKKVKTEQAVDNTNAQIIEKEELSDDTELVAVIAAAIAASEGAASTDGFVVRSIKRANTNKWQRA